MTAPALPGLAALAAITPRTQLAADTAVMLRRVARHLALGEHERVYDTIALQHDDVCALLRLAACYAPDAVAAQDRQAAADATAHHDEEA